MHWFEVCYIISLTTNVFCGQRKEPFKLPPRRNRHKRHKQKKLNNTEYDRPQNEDVTSNGVETNRPQSNDVALNNIENDRPQSNNVDSNSTFDNKKTKSKTKFLKTRLTVEEYEQLQRLRRLCGEESDSAFTRSSIKIRLNYLDTLKDQFDDHFNVNEVAYEPKYSGNYKAESLDPIIKSLRKAFTSVSDLEEGDEKDMYKMIINWLIMHLKNSQNDYLQYK